ncbi:MAG: helix-turn-helix transcriptional regulator [Eubacteriaceae bacterium]|nr:helix-turn-helix transcriptional regulator [Eubacteriaceae bacterium]
MSQVMRDLKKEKADGGENRQISLFKSVGLAMGFGFYLFVYMLCAVTANARYGEIGQGMVALFASCGLFALSAGYFLYGFFPGKETKSLVIPTAVCIAAGGLGMLVLKNRIIFVMAAMVAQLAFGVVGGYIHDIFARESGRMAAPGFAMGCGIALATVLQFAVQSGQVVMPVLTVSFPAMALLYMLESLKRGQKNQSAEIDDSPVSRQFPRSQVAVLILSVAVIAMIFGLNNGAVSWLLFDNHLNIFSGVRLFFALSAILAGAVSEIKEGRYLLISTLCAVILSLLTLTFLSAPKNDGVYLSLFYVFGGFYSVFQSLAFIGVARSFPGESRKWAGMGRAVAALANGGISLMVAGLFKDFGFQPLLIAGTGMTIFLVVLLTAGYATVAREKEIAVSEEEHLNEAIPESGARIGPEERLETFAGKYSLSAREQEVLKLVVTTDQSIRAIADEMGIIDRSVQKHLTSIYRKTGTSSRVGLVLLYHEGRNRENPSAEAEEKCGKTV